MDKATKYKNAKGSLSCACLFFSLLVLFFISRELVNLVSSVCLVQRNPSTIAQHKLNKRKDPLVFRYEDCHFEWLNTCGSRDSVVSRSLWSQCVYSYPYCCFENFSIQSFRTRVLKNHSKWQSVYNDYESKQRHTFYICSKTSKCCSAGQWRIA